MKKLLSAVLVTVMVFALAAGTIVSAAASVAVESLDNIYVNEAQLFNGGADAWLAANEIKGKIQSIGIRGWIIMGNGDMPSSFGYKIDDGEPVKVDNSVVYDQSILDATGNAYPNMRRDVFTADVSKVGLGEHTFTIAAWNEAGEVAYGKSFTFTQELAPDEKPPAIPPAIKGNNLDAWQYWYNGGALGATLAVFTHGDIVGFHIAGWFGYNYEVLAVGYRINGVETFVDGAVKTPEQAVKDIAGEYAVRYDMDGSFSTLAFGPNDFDIIVKLNDEDNTVVDLFANIPAIVMPTTEEAVYFYDPAAYTTGYWTGPAVGYADGSDIQIALTATAPFGGVFMFAFASPAPTPAVMNINLFDGSGTLLETVTQTFNGDSYAVTNFSKVYPAGDYTLQYEFADGAHFVLGSGTPTGEVYAVSGVCNIEHPDSAPSIALIKGELPPEPTKCLNAAWDDLKYDETVLCASKAYSWVVDNADALNYEEGTVSSIYMRGWAQLDRAITGFGYIIDGGELVTDAAFTEVRADVEASFPGGVGFAVTVPVSTLTVGDHSIKVVAIDENGDPVDIVKVKNSTDYPVVLNFSIAEPAPAPALIKATLDIFDLSNGVLSVAGWAGANYPANNLGYIVDGGEVVFDGIVFANFNTPEEGEIIKGMAGPDAFRFNSGSGIALDLEPGEHTITLVMRVTASEGNANVEMKSKTFTVTGEPDPAILKGMSFNTVWVDGAQICDVGDALAFLAENPIEAEQGIGLRGWAWIANSEIEAFGYRIDDGEPVVDAAYTQDRADVQAAFGQTAAYANGFMVSPIDVTALAAGDHTATIVVKAADGTYVDVVTVPFSVKAQAEAPALIKATLDIFDLSNGKLSVAGWAGANYPANNLGYKVDGGEVVFDGIVFANFNTPEEGEIIKGMAGPDAFRFKTASDIALDLEPGEHTITLVMRVNDGTQNHVVEMKTKTFTVTGQPDPAVLKNMSFNTVWVDGAQICDVGDALAFLKDAPISGEVQSIGLRGWAWIANSEIDVFGYRIDDGTPVYSASYTQDRPDVQAAFGQSAAYANGFTVSPIDVSDLEAGAHTVTVLVKAKDGTELNVVTVPFEITAPVIEHKLGFVSFDWYAKNGAFIAQTGYVNKFVDEGTGIVYLHTGYDQVGFYGWATLEGEPMASYAYSIDGGEMVVDYNFFSKTLGPNFDRTAELTGAGFPYGEGFWITFDYSALESGEHSITFYVIAEDETAIEMFSYNFSVYSVDDFVWLYNRADGSYSTGYWTGPNCGMPTGSVIIEFTAPEAFNGIYTAFFADNVPGALMQIELYNEDEELVETVVQKFVHNDDGLVKFEGVYAPGTYTVIYQYIGETGHFVLGSGSPMDVEYAVSGECNIEHPDSAPSIALLVAETTVVEGACQNAAWDELKYDENALVSEKAYKWVVDNKDALDYSEGDVSNIFFKGWAQLNKAIKGFGYILDNGDLVTDASFIQDRAAELAGAGFPGAQGFAISVPVSELKAGAHSIKIVAISEDDEVIDIFKTKEGVDYPVALSFTIKAPVAEYELGDVNMDGEINNKDVVTLFRYVSSLTHESELSLEVADMNKDGFIDNKDVVALFRLVSSIA